MELKQTPRGFDYYDFLDHNGEGCSIQKSSLATEDCIWLGMHNSMRMHLNKEQVKELLPILENFVKTGNIN